MNTKKTLGAAIATALLLGFNTAQAVSVSLSPATRVAQQGEQLSFDLIGDFDGLVLLAGNQDLGWDPSVLMFTNFSFSATLALPVRDPAFDPRSVGSTAPFDLQSSSLLSVGFANFNGINLGANPVVIGTLTFDAIGPQGSSTAITLTDSDKWAGYFDIAGNPVAVEYSGATVNPIPLPAAAWLLVSALGAISGLSLRRARTG